MKAKDNNLKTNASNTSEITEEDKNALHKKGLSMNQGDDKMLQHRDREVDFAGKGLDVPMGKEANFTPSSGIPDEENALYAQGGERNENLEAPERANLDKS